LTLIGTEHRPTLSLPDKTVRDLSEHESEEHYIEKESDFYIAFTNLKGNMRMAATSLNTASMVKAAILNGNRISHTRGNNIRTSRAMGQQHTSRKHQRIRAISVRMGEVLYSSKQGCKKAATRTIGSNLAANGFSIDHRFHK
jgi:hypothetical protein